ncbi:type II toxin-antitoxin system RelE/ParE family toxin [Novosphingobium sp. Gsoil 351]|uniref:type II toxin-antitoxin system RelE/ParE family toxin n=1 Tax=Novosphingobium sp. Gsoil 351 TaxID=2675225 RepID=UPI0012B4F152|nr:type II toxin-antitoxin system RelE/ParE family toxin [Novosphingobium sp. Gsoil 351]QGN55144.1 type II toxin-antitoxin system RelE/ParE family toxin [Novosphingobium sp. Gsoil 351]
MAELSFSIAAQSDLADIEEYGVREFGPDVAEVYMRRLIQALAFLARYPRSAPERPDYGEGIRSKTVRKHLILHQVDASGVFVVRILHHSRDVSRHLKS